MDKNNPPTSDSEEELYYPDPNAPLRHKLNPCHIDHLYSLDLVQRFMELFASNCKCCSGTRVFLLLVSWLLMFCGYHVVAFILVFVVAMAVLYDKWVE